MPQAQSRTGRARITLLALALVILASPVARAAERRVALVIGNQSYARAALANPVNDAEAVAAVLERIGFTVTKAVNLTRRQTRETVSAYLEVMRDGDLSFFYYSDPTVERRLVLGRQRLGFPRRLGSISATARSGRPVVRT